MLRPDSKQCASAERIELSAGGEWHISRLSSSSPSSRTGNLFCFRGEICAEMRRGSGRTRKSMAKLCTGDSFQAAAAAVTTTSSHWI